MCQRFGVEISLGMQQINRIVAGRCHVKIKVGGGSIGSGRIPVRGMYIVKVSNSWPS